MLIPILVVGMLFVSRNVTPVFADEQTARTYTESTDEIVNPAAGFYKRVTVKLRRNSDVLASSVYDGISGYAKSYGILQVCFDLADFSGNAGGVTTEIDAKAQDAIEQTLALLRLNKVGAILRFDYNRDGTTSNGRYIDAEPDLDTVLKHIENVSKPISKYSDVVLGIESGMLGPWGEQHSTTLASSGANTFYRLVQKWLDKTPQKIGITVRRPLFFAYWANEKLGLNLTVSDLADHDFSACPEVKRVGVFNDGYLGSSSDLGTFTDRAAETAFIGKQAEHTYYGGELVADSRTGLMGEYNSVAFLETEGFVTHTSYLNIDWNDKVIAQYKANTYNGVDALYGGKTSELTFIKNRLGYRFYLSQSVDMPAGDTGKASFKFTVSNAGFARLLCPSRTELVFKAATVERTVDCSAYVDLTQVPSAGEKTFEFAVDVPNDLPAGDCDVYLRAYTEYGAEIRFANDSTVCAPERKGVKLATVNNVVSVTLSGITVTTPPTKTTYTVGETLDITGLAVTATCTDGTTQAVTVTVDMLSDYDMNRLGVQHVTVTYEGKTAAFGIVVNAENPPAPPDVPPAVDGENGVAPSFGERFTNFINDNAVAVGCGGAAVIAVAAVMIIAVVVKRKK